jgi:hypothetical protein
MAPRKSQKRCSCEVISFNDTLFFYVWEVTTVRLRLSVFYIGSESLAYRFKYVFAVCKRSSLMRHSWGGRVLELHDCNARFSEGNSISLTMSTFRYVIRSYHNPSAPRTVRRAWLRMNSSVLTVRQALLFVFVSCSLHLMEKQFIKKLKEEELHFRN